MTMVDEELGKDKALQKLKEQLAVLNDKMKVLVEPSHRFLTNLSPTLFAELDPPMNDVVQNLQIDFYSLSVLNATPLQTSVREVAN